MRHLILYTALIALPFSAALAEEQDSNEQRDTYAYDRDQAEDPERTETTFERTSEQSDQPTEGEDYEFEQTGDQMDTTQEQQEGSAFDQEQSATFEQTTAEDQAEEDTDTERTQSTTVGFDQEGQQQQQQQQQSGMGGDAEVARAQFTSDVQDREPVDEVNDFQTEEAPLYFFTEIDNAQGETVTHRWIRDGEVMAEVPLEVGGDQDWRTWSSKEMMPDWEGEWTVEVVDSQGNVLEERSINVEGGAQTRNVGFEQDDQDQGATFQESGAQDDQEATFQESGAQDDQQATFQESGAQDDQEATFQESGTQDDQGAEFEETGTEQGEDDWWEAGEQDDQQDQQDQDRDTNQDW